MNFTTKRILAFLLCTTMILSFPTSAVFAEVDEIVDNDVLLEDFEDVATPSSLWLKPANVSKPMLRRSEPAEVARLEIYREHVAIYPGEDSTSWALTGDVRPIFVRAYDAEDQLLDEVPEVIWDISGNYSSGTYIEPISNGMAHIHIGEDELDDRPWNFRGITMTATLASDPEIVSNSDNVSIVNCYVRTVVEQSVQNAGNQVSRGSEVAFSYEVYRGGGQPPITENAEEIIGWRIAEHYGVDGEKYSYITPEGVLVVGLEEPADLLNIHPIIDDSQYGYSLSQEIYIQDPYGPIMRTLTTGTGADIITVTGQILPDATLTNVPGYAHARGTDSACDAILDAEEQGLLLALHDISLPDGSFTGELTVTISIPAQYNGKEVSILHCKNSVLETLTATVQDGKVTFQLDSLSPIGIVFDGTSEPAEVSVHVAAPGGLQTAIEACGITPETITRLTITGHIDAADLNYLWDYDGTPKTVFTTLAELDMSEAVFEGSDIFKTLPEHQFEGIPLQKIVLPQGINGIGNFVFADCSNLEIHIYSGTVVLPSATTFMPADAITVVVPNTMISAYQEQEAWILTICDDIQISSVDVNVTCMPVITQQPSGNPRDGIIPIQIEEGDTYTLSVEAGAAGSGTLSYQWYLNNNAISGANEASYTVPGNLSARDYEYYVEVTNSNPEAVGAKTATTKSNTIYVTVKVPATATVPGSLQNFTAIPGDGQVTLSWEAPISNGGAIIIGYLVSSDNGETWVSASSATGHTFTGLANGTSYTFKVQAFNTIGGGATAAIVMTPGISPQDLTDAIVTIAGSYTYTGSTITPPPSAMTVILDGNTLVNDIDYTYAVISADNTSAGIVTVMITGKGSYTGNKTAAFTIQKAFQSTPPAPVLDSKTATTVNLYHGNANVAFRMGTDGTWQNNGSFSNLTPNTTYTFYARMIENENYLESPVSQPLTVTTDSAAITHTITFNAYGGSVATATMQTGTDGKLASLPIPTRSGSYRFDGWFTAARGGTKVTADTVFNAGTTVYARWTNISSGSGSGSGGSSGGGGSATTTINPSATPLSTITWLEAGAVPGLIQAAKDKELSFIYTCGSGLSGVRATAWPGMPGYEYRHGTLDGDLVQVQISIKQPANINTDFMVSGYVKGLAADSVKALFETWFKNKIRVIHFDQTGTWGQPAEIAAKVDLAGMDVTKLYFYSNDKATNTCPRIENPNYWIDESGYLHFTSIYAGDIIISEGPLTPKVIGVIK